MIEFWSCQQKGIRVAKVGRARSLSDTGDEETMAARTMIGSKLGKKWFKLIASKLRVPLPYLCSLFHAFVCVLRSVVCYFFSVFLSLCAMLITYYLNILSVHVTAHSLMLGLTGMVL